ncbi:hypothetical protein WSM22_02890 [Cytophagales bacterium WSM2-2]|nr:hypothetical protein WSM22_02890 [Cytophagales bacterium WSM2-2]
MKRISSFLFAFVLCLRLIAQDDATLTTQNNSAHTGNYNVTLDKNLFQGIINSKFSLYGGGTLALPSVLTGSNTNTFKLSFPSIGATPANGVGLFLSNPDLATLGNQKISPSLALGASGFKTNTTAGPQSVVFDAYVTPVQGSAAPSGTLDFYSQINNGAHNKIFTLNSNSASATLQGSITVGASGNPIIVGNGTVNGTLGLNITSSIQPILINGQSESASIAIGNSATSILSINSQILNLIGGTSGSTITWDDDAVNSGRIEIGQFAAGIDILSYDSPGFTGGSIDFSIGSGQIFINDTKSSKTGVQYTTPEIYVTQNNSITDKQYVDKRSAGLTITNSPSINKALVHNGTNLTWQTVGAGTVTSVGITPGSNITVSGSPVTGSGNITVNAVPTGTTGTLLFNNAGIITGVESGQFSASQSGGVLLSTRNTGVNATSYVNIYNPGEIDIANGISPTIDNIQHLPTGLTKNVGVAPMVIQHGVSNAGVSIQTANVSTSNAGGISIQPGSGVSAGAGGGAVTITAGGGNGGGGNGDITLITGGSGSNTTGNINETAGNDIFMQSGTDGAGNITIQAPVGSKVSLVSDIFDSGSVNTGTGGGTVSILLVPTTSNKNITIEAILTSRCVAGSCATGDGGFAKKIASFKNVAGTLTQIGATASMFSTASGAGSPALSFGISGSSVNAQVNVGSGENYACRIQVNVLSN